MKVKEYVKEVYNYLGSNVYDYHKGLENIESLLLAADEVVEKARELMTATNMPRVSAQGLFDSVTAYDKLKGEIGGE